MNTAPPMYGRPVAEITCPDCGFTKKMDLRALLEEFDFEREAIAHESTSGGKCSRYRMSARCPPH